jgi:hypothetical protein
MRLNWTDFKSFVSQRNSSIQCVEMPTMYWLHAFSQPYNAECFVLKDGRDDQTDFETNFKSSANQPISSVVTTQYELNDKTLKLACLMGSYDVITNLAVLQMQVPGTFTGVDPNSCDGRFVAGGYAFSDAYKFGDRAVKIEVVDVDNLFGMGANTVVKTYTDQDVDASNSGWYLYASPSGQGEVEIDPIGGYGFLPAGLYLRITFERVAGSPATSVIANLWWGKRE